MKVKFRFVFSFCGMAAFLKLSRSKSALFYVGRLNQYLYLLIAGKELDFPLSLALFAVKITLNGESSHII